MTSLELKAERKKKKMTQDAFAQWLGVKKRTVVAWETEQNPVPEWVENRLRDDVPELNPKLSLDVVRGAIEKADAEGISLDEWIAKVIKNAIKLLIFLCLIAKLTHSPTDWSGEALAQAAMQGASWFGSGVGLLGNAAWIVACSFYAVVS